jgi:hypothetical protein
MKRCALAGNALLPYWHIGRINIVEHNINPIHYFTSGDDRGIKFFDGSGLACKKFILTRSNSGEVSSKGVLWPFGFLFLSTLSRLWPSVWHGTDFLSPLSG